MEDKKAVNDSAEPRSDDETKRINTRLNVSRAVTNYGMLKRLFNWGGVLGPSELMRYIMKRATVKIVKWPDNNDKLRIKFYTNTYVYRITMVKPGTMKQWVNCVNTACWLDTRCNKCKYENFDYGGYLGLIYNTRTPRAGEDWNRGWDLPDWKYTEETMEKIKDSIISREMILLDM